MADNTQLSTNVGVGQVYRSLVDGDGVNWGVGVTSYATTLSAGANTLQVVTLTSGLPVQPSTGSTWAVSAASLPLPSGAATAANQATEITSLSAIATSTATTASVLSASAAGTTPLVVTISGGGGGGGTSSTFGATFPSTGTAVGASDGTNMQALRVDGSGNLKVVGAGTAGSPSGGVVSIQGVASGTVVPISAASLPLPTGAATEGTLSSLTMISSSIATNTSLTAANTLQTASNTNSTASAVIAINSKTPDLVSGSVPCVLTAGSASIGSVTQGTSPWVVSLTSTTITGTVAVTQSGSWTVGVSGSVTVAQATAASLNATVVGTGTFAVQAADTPQTTGGLSVYSTLQTSAAVIAANVKGSAGQVYGVECFNTGAAAVYVRLYNNTNNPPTTSDTPFWRGVIPGNTAGAGFVKSWPQGLAMGTGIGVRVTGAIADNDATALTANQVIINMDYK